MEIILYILGGLVLGSSVTFGVMSNNKPIIVPSDPVAKELGKLDVVQPVCEPNFIEKNSDDLCRELMCMTQTNSATGEVSGITCDNITNLRNKKSIIDFCKDKDEFEKIETCIDIFSRRGL
tara:strand:- start:139 stop:501 length:363 start_codon:yes stop_codon:yes gene_type:complete